MRQLRTRYAEGIYRHKYYTVTLKSRLSITHGLWKRILWIDRTRLSRVRPIWRWILSWTWKSVRDHSTSLKVVAYHLKAWVRFPIHLPYSNYGRIFSHFGDIQRQAMAWPWNLGLGSIKVIENGAVWQTMYDFLLVRHCNYSSILYRLRVIWRRILSWPWIEA